MTNNDMTARDAMLLSCDYRNRFYLNRMRQEVQHEQRTYIASKLLLGLDEKGSDVHITMKSDPFCAVIVAKRGSGKTFSIRRIIDQWILTNDTRRVFIMDTKDEYKTLMSPVQSGSSS